MPFEAYGVRLLASTNSRQVYERLPAILPPGAIACSAQHVKHKLILTASPDGSFALDVDDKPFLPGLKFEIALELLETQIRAHVALEARDRVFVHAGVVGIGQGAILMPGRSFTGKTTLVAEFVRAGAAYYSDEYAVLDEQGRVHPYPKPLSLRGEDHQQIDHSAASLGGTTGDAPLPIETIILCTYRPEAEWRPSTLSPGQGVMEVLANAVAVRTKPDEALHAIARAVEDATVLAGDRGEAATVVKELLAGVSA
jgi:hypothetical protein